AEILRCYPASLVVPMLIIAFPLMAWRNINSLSERLRERSLYLLEIELENVRQSIYKGETAKLDIYRLLREEYSLLLAETVRPSIGRTVAYGSIAYSYAIYQAINRIADMIS
ncbi:MAG: hypothetical protein LRS43_02510, partial [Desulfurococcales archaeon]|nr:hypothetical protein [Desulfurococcales archaeon]